MQDTTIVTIKQELFRTLKIEYFYLELLENTHAIENYIILEKNVCYRNIYIFTQQIRYITSTKKINR